MKNIQEELRNKFLDYDFDMSFTDDGTFIFENLDDYNDAKEIVEEFGIDDSFNDDENLTIYLFEDTTNPYEDLSEDVDLEEEIMDETYSDEELHSFVGKTFNQQRVLNIYRRHKYNDSRLFAHTRCVNCGREKRVFVSNLVNDPDKYGSCICSDTNIESRMDNIHDLYAGNKKLSSNTSGYTGVYFVKTYKGEPYNKWRAYIEVDGKRTYLGDFNSKSKAIKARKTAGEKGIKWYKEHKNEFMKTTRGRYKRYRTKRANRIKANAVNNRSSR